MVDNKIITKIPEQANLYSMQSDPGKPAYVTPNEM
jgi:hypothetical protein